MISLAIAWDLWDRLTKQDIVDSTSFLVRISCPSASRRLKHEMLKKIAPDRSENSR